MGRQSPGMARYLLCALDPSWSLTKIEIDYVKSHVSPLGAIGDLPNCLRIKNVDKLGPAGFGGSWKGRIANQVVLMKVMKVSLLASRQRKPDVDRFVQKAAILQQLRHPNLLPFAGIHHFGQIKNSCPWFRHGWNEAHDVVSGLSHLHRTKIIHGDMRGFNVLITPEMRACMGGFGPYFGRNGDESDDTLKFSVPFTIGASGTGSARWLGPELFGPEPFSAEKSDVYACGCVCYEIFAGHATPFHSDLKDAAAIFAALRGQGQIPSRPKKLEDDAIWELMNSCWNFDPSLRPTAADVLKTIRHLSSSRGANLQDAPD
ncbi:hypothetical protein PM082_002069 [Marasmius tenuissimus]|nr:hypothetical protein PM082_002069 [Marasmius tenuissimus]